MTLGHLTLANAAPTMGESRFSLDAGPGDHGWMHRLRSHTA
jgi:hypothetical protein